MEEHLQQLQLQLLQQPRPLALKAMRRYDQYHVVTSRCNQVKMLILFHQTSHLNKRSEILLKRQFTMQKKVIK